MLTSYINSAESISARNEALLGKGVDCYCPSCKKGAIARESEVRRQRLQEVISALRAYDGGSVPDKLVSMHLVPNHPTQALVLAEEAIALLIQERLIDMGLAKTYRQASKYSLQLGMVDNAKALAVKELEVERICLGPETEFLEGGNADAWMKEILWKAEKDSVKIRMCEKRGMKERKQAEKKAAKKAGKCGR